MTIYQLIYTSKKSKSLPIMDIPQIADSAMASNMSKEITGALLYRQSRFLQILEGDSEKVNSLYLKIAADNRHTELELVYAGYCEQRLFSKWSMKYVNLEKSDSGLSGQATDKGMEEFRFPTNHVDVFKFIKKYLD